MSTLADFLTGIANAIRGKTGEIGSIPASSFAEKISERIDVGEFVLGLDTDCFSYQDSVDFIFLVENFARQA